MQRILPQWIATAIFASVFLILAPAWSQTYTVSSQQKIADNTGGFGVTLTNSDFFGESIANIGDLDNDGVEDLAVGAFLDDTGGTSRGAVYILFMDTNGTVKSNTKIASNTGGFTGLIGNEDRFGRSVAGIGDLDNDGVEDIAVGANRDDTGGTDRGAVYILFLNTDGTVKSSIQIAHNTGGFGTLVDSDRFGESVAGIGDIDGDGIEDIAVGAQRDDTNGSLRGAVYIINLNTNGTVKSSTKIADNTGGFNTTLANDDLFGTSVANLGDIDNDGVNDLAVGATGDDTGGNSKGAVYVLLMNSAGTVKSSSKIADNTGGFTSSIGDFAQFGFGVAGPGDLDGDGVEDLWVGANSDNATGSGYVIFLNSTGTAKGNSKITSGTNGFGTLSSGDQLGVSVAGIGDLNSDGVRDLVIGAPNDATNGAGRGAIYVVFGSVTAANGTLTAASTISEPVALATTITTAGAATSIFDFTITDGGTDSKTLDITQVTLAISGTATASKASFLLSGPDATDVAGTLSGSTLTFASLSISIADGANETYTVKAYYNDNTSITDNQTIILTIDGDTNLTVNSSNTQMTGTNTAVSNSTGTTTAVIATQLAFTTQPAPLALTSGTQLDLTTDPVVTAQDAAGNTDTDFASTVTLAENGSGTSSFSNNSVTPSSGVATFSGVLLTYNATSAASITLSASASGVTAAASSSFAVTAFPNLDTNKGARISEGGTLTLGNSLLKFTDSASTASQIVYTLSSLPGFGQLQLSGTTLASGATFTQDDLDNSRLTYVHLGGDEVFADGFDFTVQGSPGVATSAFRFDLAIDRTNDQPRLDVLQTLRLQEGETITITNGNLRALDGDHLGKHLAIALVQSPQHGQLNLGGFTQADIDERQLTYRHDGSETTADRFVFTVTDAEGSARANIGIDFEITPVNDAPVLPVLSEQQATEGQTFTLAVAISDPESDAFTTALSGLPEGAIFADGTLSWTPTFADAGRYGVTLTATDAHGAAGARRFDLNVADAGAPDLALAAVDFGAVDVGQTVERTLTISNPTDLPLVIAPVEDVPADNRVFTMILPPSPLIVAPRQQAELTVNFAPRRATPAKHTATLVCPTNLGPITVPVAGSSRWSQLALSEPLLDFGAVPLGGAKRLHVEAHNPGTAPLVVEGITCTVDGLSATPSRFTLAPGARRSLALTYAPARPTRTAGLVRLQIADQPSQVIAVQGAGRAAPEGFVHLDFDLGDRDQSVRRKDAVQVGDLVEVQLVIENAPAIEGWATRIAYDPAQLSYVPGSFQPSDFIPSLQGLADDTQPGLLEVGGAVLARSVAGPESGAGRGVLGTLTFRVEGGFADEADLAVTRVRLRRMHHDGLTVDIVHSAATLVAQRLFRPDFDGDGRVEFDDFFLFGDVFGQPTTGTTRRFDLDDNGAIDFADFFAFADAFGQAAPAGKRAAQPLATGLAPGYPNPFNAETTLRYTLAADGPVALAIYNLAGQRVRTLVAQPQTAGRHAVVWHGRDERGQPVATGRYFARFHAQDAIQIQGITLLK